MIVTIADVEGIAGNRTMAVRERPAEFAILGLLEAEDDGSHGYDLARHFASGQPLGEILRLEPGMLYHHLKRLERSVCVTSTTSQTGSRPPRQTYQITDHGRNRLRKWLQSPVEHTREIRLEFLVKLYFAERLDPELAARLIETQLRTLLELRETLQERHQNDGADAFLDSVLALRIAQTDAAIQWLEGLHGTPVDPPAETSPTGMP